VSQRHDELPSKDHAKGDRVVFVCPLSQLHNTTLCAIIARIPVLLQALVLVLGSVMELVVVLDTTLMMELVVESASRWSEKR
jgi:hypothetical protein